METILAVGIAALLILHDAIIIGFVVAGAAAFKVVTSLMSGGLEDLW